VELQIRVAEGHPLPAAALSPQITGHSIEVRLTAEDPAQGYMPMTGTFHRFELPAAAGLRVDTGITSGSAISPHYDSMVAKVISHGTDRLDAIRRLHRALTEARVHGPVTNLEQLRQILVDPRFVSGDIHTGFLDDDACITPVEVDDETLIATALTIQATHRAEATTWNFTPSGWRNNPAVAHSLQMRVGDREVEVRYQLGKDHHFEVIENGVGRAVPITQWSADPSGATINVDGISQRYQIDLVPDLQGTLAYAHGPHGSQRLIIQPRFPDADLAGAAGSLTAPMPGAIRRVYVSVGDRVTAGTPLLALEAMKMEHQVLAPGDGVVAEVMIEVGAQVDTGQTLLRLEDSETTEEAAS
jgi:propionyl-CoA carboxylase alpha chain